MLSFYFKDIKVNICNLRSSTEFVLSYLNFKKPAFICVTDAGNIVNAYRNSPELKEAINSSLLSLPDGRPVSLFAGLKGIKGIDRVAGPDFMERIFEMTSDKKVKHFFLGDTEEILGKMKFSVEKNYNLDVNGTLSPAFGEWSLEMNDEIIKCLNESGADLIWVSFGGGKQEIWMKDNFVKLNKGIMIGVGAAFRFYLGEIQRAPVILQRTGFEWMYRLIQQPSKMFKRYLSTLPYFILYSAQEFFRKSKILTF